MNEADRSVAFARVKQRVAIALLIAPANLTLYVALCSVHNTAINLNGLFREVISSQPILIILILILLDWSLSSVHRWRTHAVSLIGVEVRQAKLSSKVLDLELNAAKLNNITLFKSVVLFRLINLTSCNLRGRALEVSDYDEHLVIDILVEMLLRNSALLGYRYQCVIFYLKLA